jgi:hypothetical protein
VAGGVASGWDAIADSAFQNARRATRARLAAIGLTVVAGSSAALVALACIYHREGTARLLNAFAVALGAPNDGRAGQFMLSTLPRGAVPLVILSLATMGLLVVVLRAKGQRSNTTWAMPARCALYVLIIGDLLVRAWGINPVLDATYVAEPVWILHTTVDPDARFYLGGKKEGTLDGLDIDASRWYLNAPGLTGSAARAALNIQAAYYPSGWHAREMLSYDLAVLWPRRFTTTNEHFMNGTREERDRFLDRTGVRYRVLPIRQASGRTPVMPIPYFMESFLFDWGGDVAPRATVVSDTTVVPDVEQQIDALFQPGWDSRTTALLERIPEAAGNVGLPVLPFARFVADTPNRVVVEAGAARNGGHLVLLDSYSPDWSATVDGHQATIVQADGLFRAVRLPPGRHVVEFLYRPTSLVWGATISAAALALTIGLLAWPWRTALALRTRERNTAARTV